MFELYEINSLKVKDARNENNTYNINMNKRETYS